MFAEFCEQFATPITISDTPFDDLNREEQSLIDDVCSKLKPMMGSFETSHISTIESLLTDPNAEAALAQYRYGNIPETGLERVATNLYNQPFNALSDRERCIVQTIMMYIGMVFVDQTVKARRNRKMYDFNLNVKHVTMMDISSDTLLQYFQQKFGYSIQANFYVLDNRINPGAIDMTAYLPFVYMDCIFRTSEIAAPVANMSIAERELAKIGGPMKYRDDFMNTIKRMTYPQDMYVQLQQKPDEAKRLARHGIFGKNLETLLHRITLQRDPVNGYHAIALRPEALLNMFYEDPDIRAQYNLPKEHVIFQVTALNQQTDERFINGGMTNMQGMTIKPSTVVWRPMGSDDNSFITNMSNSSIGVEDVWQSIARQRQNQYQSQAQYQNQYQNQTQFNYGF